MGYDTLLLQGKRACADVTRLEPLHKEYLPTAKVLDHFDYELNEVRGGVEDYSGQKRKVRVALLAGGKFATTA